MGNAVKDLLKATGRVVSMAQILRYTQDDKITLRMTKGATA